MRITLVSRIFAPEPSAASLRLAAVVRECTERGATVQVLTTHPPAGLDRDIGLSARVSRWPVFRDSSGYVRGYVQYMSFDIPAFFRVLFGRRANAIVVEPPPTTGFMVRLAAVLRRTPYVYFAADIWSDAAASTGAASWIVSGVRWLESQALRGAAHVVAVSDAVAQRVASLAPRTPTTVVGHGVDTDLFTPEGSRPSHPADIVYVGTASEWHGARVAMEAVITTLQRDTSLTAAFIGQGSDWPVLTEMAAASPVADRIRMLPTVPVEEAASWLRAARVSIATLKPGIGYDFAVPTKIYSSLATGTPVAYAGPDPVRSMISDHSLGEACEYGSDALASAISRVCEREDALTSHVRSWATQNVSAQAVAGRTASAIMAAARGR